MLIDEFERCPKDNEKSLKYFKRGVMQLNLNLQRSFCVHLGRQTKERSNWMQKEHKSLFKSEKQKTLILGSGSEQRG